MKVLFRLINKGVIVGEQHKEYDGTYSGNAKEIENDVLDGMDPLKQAMDGGPVRWIEAVHVRD